MASRQEEKEQRRAERLAAERDAEAAGRRRRLGLIGAGVAAAIVAIVVVVVLVSSGGSDDGKSASTTSADQAAQAEDQAASLPGAQTGPPPWNAGNGPELQQRLDALGLAALPAEGTVVHIHQHLDLFVDGKRVTVPAAIGIDAGQQFIAALHTHDPSGVMHVESPEPKTFTLGQFFGVWGVPLSATQIGGLKAGAGKQLRAWVNGKPVSGDPSKVDLASHQEIAIAYGTAAQMPKPVPSSYGFPSGE
jgi:hypothetical protein